MSWGSCKLGDIVNLKRGYDLPNAKRVAGEIPVVSSSGVSGSHNEAKVSSPAVVTGRYGTLGKVYYVDKDCWPLNTSLYVQDFKGNRPKFIYYFLQSVLKGMQSDKAAVPGVNRNDLHARQVVFPEDEKQQESIEDLLAPYDDLIENNRRRIQLLEESARLLYKEWFIHLRFPRHEHTKIIDGVPEGWERKTLGGCVTLNYGKALKKDNRIDGDYSVYGSSGIVGSHNKAIVKPPTIIIGRKGNVGSVYWSVYDCWPIDTVYFIQPEESDLYLYYALKNMTFISTDVAVPGLNRNLAYSRSIIIPAKKIKAEFNDEASLIRAQIEKLGQYNQKLAQARDLLLPRLMNGKIEV